MKRSKRAQRGRRQQQLLLLLLFLRCYLLLLRQLLCRAPQWPTLENSASLVSPWHAASMPP